MNQDIIQEIRSKVDIVDVISSYIPLSKHGKNFFCVCPFHDDNNPSMSVSREKQIYRCFSCGATGNVFTFVENYEHISFQETLRILGEKAGVTIQNLQVREKNTKYDKYYEIYDLTGKLYQNNLKSSLGSVAREYLKNRNINDELINEFKIGLSTPENDILTRTLAKKNYTVNDLNLLGLSNGSNDMFQDRIMFPLFDPNGRIVAFSGRRYKNEEGSKYINSKETPIFIKGNNVYNYHKAREEVRVKKEVIVMEGFMDVIRSYTAGIKNVVALMGTAMTDAQANLIKRLSNNIILCFDGDAAGIHATIANGEAFEKMGLNVRVIELSDNEDPDTYITKYGKDSFISLKENAITYQDFKIKQLKIGRNLSSDLEKAKYINDVLKIASEIDDEIRCEIILKKLAIDYDLSYNTLEKRLNELRSQIIKNDVNINSFQPQLLERQSKKDKYYIAPRAVLYAMIENIDVLTRYNTTGIFFPDEKFRRFASEISKYYQNYHMITVADFCTYLSDKEELNEIFNEIVALELPKLDDAIVSDYIKVMEEDYKNQEIKRLKKLIKETNDINEKMRLSERVRSIKLGS